MTVTQQEVVEPTAAAEAPTPDAGPTAGSISAIRTQGSHGVTAGPSRARRGLRATGHFVAHFFEMCAVMCVGLGLLDLAYLAMAQGAGYANPFVDLPVLSTCVIAFNMTAPMAAWMRFRGMEWRLINEMSAGMIAEAALLLVLYWLSVVPARDLFPLQHGLMMPAMLIPMFLRLDHYTGRMRHTTHVV